MKILLIAYNSMENFKETYVFENEEEARKAQDEIWRDPGVTSVTTMTIND